MLSDARIYIKDPIIQELSERIDPNIRFFQKLGVYGLRIGLITLSKTEDVERQLDNFGIPRIFAHMECGGDPAYSSVPKGEKKKEGYIRLAGGLGVEPGRTLTFEDTEDGVKAACAAGVPVIGIVRGKDLPEADLAVVGDLGGLEDATYLFEAAGDAEELVDSIARYMIELAMPFTYKGGRK